MIKPKELVTLAEQARERSYCPYSRFAVGAALLCADGTVFTGCNIENAAFGPSVCAERTAIFKAVSEGRRDFAALAVAGGPAGSPVDRREAVINQIERFAPGFRDTILAVSSRTAVGIEHVNPNHIGGDISSGAPTLGQLFARPVVRTDPWRTPIPGVYLASASTAPGPGVHGLAGWHAAQSALRNEFGIRTSPDLSPTAATR